MILSLPAILQTTIFYVSFDYSSFNEGTFNLQADEDSTLSKGLPRKFNCYVLNLFPNILA